MRRSKMPVNPWLEQKLKERKPNPELLELIIEVERDTAAEVASRIEALGVEVHRERISWGRFVPVAVTAEMIPTIENIPHVKVVHYSMPKYPYFFPLLLRKVDPLLGEIKVSRVEIPFEPQDILEGALPALPFWGPLGRAMGPVREGVEMWPTSKTRKIVEAPVDNTVYVKTAVLDTGIFYPFHPMATRSVDMHSTTGEPPFDGLGHGTHCHTTAFVGLADSRFGVCKSVADSVNTLHVKCLTNAGFGSTESVLSAMEYAYNWGAKVISMSLGGPLQGSVEDDPEIKIIQETGDEVCWVVAAGNEGPSEWTIGSPAAAPKALTVGSYSPRYNDVAVFSSRGPNAGYYKNNPDTWARDYAKYGENLLKPDCLAPGGGPIKEGQTPVDLIYSGCQGWTEGMYDLTPGDGFEGMRGTSMACPHAAGLVALLLDRGYARNVADVKRVLRKMGNLKDTAQGYGLIRFGMFPPPRPPTEYETIIRVD